MLGPSDVNYRVGRHRFRHTTEYEMVPSFRPLGWLLEKLVVNRTMRRELTATADTPVERTLARQ